MNSNILNEDKMEILKNLILNGRGKAGLSTDISCCLNTGREIVTLVFFF